MLMFLSLGAEHPVYKQTAVYRCVCVCITRTLNKSPVGVCPHKYRGMRHTCSEIAWYFNSYDVSPHDTFILRRLYYCSEQSNGYIWCSQQPGLP